MENFTPLASGIGGALIGLSASMMLLFNGRVTGISGIVGGVIRMTRGDVAWRLAFLGGLLSGGLALLALMPSAFTIGIERSPGALVLAGLLVGFGTRLGNGCTSGHGVCGLSRLSPRSLVATLSFMSAGGIAAAVVTHVFGGSL